ncbi:MAG: T9SS type A sorting domain-containing protein [Bacteroidetes bacterium]|nr:T9SS type A sorting domain-containing protein [Bacteroidota bacterium]
MKKMLSLFVLTVLPGLVFAGNPPKKMLPKLDNGELSDVVTTPIRAKVNESILIGNSVNSIAWQASGTNQIYYDVASGTIAVVKRRGSLDTAIPIGSGQIVTHQSLDRGDTWSAGNHINATLPHQNGRHPNVAVLPTGELITLWNDIYNGAMFGILGVASTKLSDGTLISAYLDSTLSAEIDENPGVDEAIYEVQNELFVDEKNNEFYFSGTAVNYPNTLFLFKSANKGQSHQLVKLWKNVNDGGQIADVSTTHGDFFGDFGYFIAQVLPDSAWAVANGLTPNVWAPYLVQIQNGSIVDEGFLDLGEIFTSLGIDSWTYEWDMVTDKDGNWHMFIHGYKTGDTKTNVGIYEIWSNEPGLTNIKSKKVAEITLVECEIDGLNDLYGAADIHAARDSEGKYVFVKYLDWDPTDYPPKTSTEMYVSGRAISSENFVLPLAVNDNDFVNQFFTQAAPRVSSLGFGDSPGTRKFQIHSSWVEFGGNPASGISPANLYYSGPKLDVPVYYLDGDSATVTFKVNTAFVQDTLSAGSSVSIRGSAFGGDWSFDKGIKFTNIGGDYWMAEKTVHTGNVGGSFKIVTQTKTGTGWERHTIYPFDITEDTTITYYTTGLKETYTDPFTGASITRGDDWNPLELAKNGASDVFAVHFRVNMQAIYPFKPTQNVVTVRGSFNGWSAADTLKPEVRHDDIGPSPFEAEKYFFSKTILIPKSSAGEQKYKFVWGKGTTTNWESISDRTFNLSGDTTLYWKWFDGYDECFGCPEPGVRPFAVNFEVDMLKAINTNGFDKSTDTLIARIGFLGTAMKTVDVKLVTPFAGTLFTGSTGVDSLYTEHDRVVFYQYYKKNAAGEFEEFYFDNYNTTYGSAAPKFRNFTTPEQGNTAYTEDLLDDAVSTHRQPFFKNMDSLGVETTLTLEVGLWPALFYTTYLDGKLYSAGGEASVIDASNIRELGIYVNGPATGGWEPWDPDKLGEPRKMKSLGCGLYSIELAFSPSAKISQEFKLGIGGFDNEAAIGINHVVNLFPIATNSTFVQFGDIHPLRYVIDENNYWDFIGFKGAKNGYPVYICTRPKTENLETPQQIALSAYPNPFNPATLISYSIPQAGKVSLKVFDLLGRQVSILSEEIKPAGTHQIPFRGDDLASGIYIVRMESGSKTESVKVILLK